MSGVTKVGQKKCSMVPDEDADVGSGLAWF